MFRNIEGLQDFNIIMPETRISGLSAMIRAKDELEYLEYAVASIIDWMDEIVICVQTGIGAGVPIDLDPTLIMAFMIKEQYPGKIKVFSYPFNSFPNGPGHDKQSRNSVYERAYFYNWCLSKTNHEYVCKWDGDMIALDGVGETIRARMEDYHLIYLTGAEMVSWTNQSVNPYTACEPRIFKVEDHTYYITGAYCEQFTHNFNPVNQKILSGHQFKHFKWAKSESSITKAWPENWRDISHFQELMDRKQQGREYAGPE